MTYPEPKKSILTPKGIEQKAPEHRKAAMKDKYQETLRSPIKPLIRLTLENLLDINEQLRVDASRDRRIEYSGTEEIQVSKLRKLIELTPGRDILEIAAYYLKNIILLQAFPDGNHRTALYAVELFLRQNGHTFDYTPVEAYEFRKELYNRRLQKYKTYEERPASVLKEEDNQISNSVFAICLEFVKAHVR